MSGIVDRCDFHPGERIANRYVVSKVLGEGSFGKVYRVTDDSRHEFALKLLRLWEVPPDIREPLMERFEMEFKTGQIDCDNLVRSLDYGTVGGNPFIVMEFCPGGDLTPLVGSGDRRIPQVCRQILTGLHALHAQGKVHRDLKPENVLFKASGVAALTDFGIAGDRNKRMTERNIFGKPEQIFGTYAYMPPEQVNRARGGATVLPTTDIFSFGVLAFQLLTGELPFGSLTDHNELARYQIRGKKGEWSTHLLHGIPYENQWMRMIDGCLQPDFKKRLQSVEEVARYLPEGSSMPLPTPQVVSKPASSTGRYLLRVMQGEEYGKTYLLSELTATGLRRVTVGRDPSNLIAVREYATTYISRRHCTLETNEDRTLWVVRDGQWIPEERTWKESRNGTFVNSTQVTMEGLRLKAGDILSMGEAKLRFEQF